MATVTTARFLPGTEVALRSFVRANPWFRGPTLVIHDGDEAVLRRRLIDIPDLRPHRIGDELRTRVSELVRQVPSLARKGARFWSLEAFNLPVDQPVLLLDGDTLCVGDARGILQHPGGLLACPDLASRRGSGREARSFVRDRGAAPTFNAGVLLLRLDELDPDVFPSLLERLDPERWATVGTGHTDQVVLNDHFGSMWAPLPNRFNALVPPTLEVASAEVEGAVFLHFVGRPKPWEAPLPPAGAGARRAAHAAWRRAARVDAVEAARRGRLAPLLRLVGRGLRTRAHRIRARAGRAHPRPIARRTS